MAGNQPRAQAIADVALKIPPGPERDEYIRVACGADTHLSSEVDAIITHDARNRGDNYALSILDTYIQTIANLAADKPAIAISHLRPYLKNWTPAEFHIHHHNCNLALSYIDLYQGDGRASFERIQQQMPIYRRSGFWRVQHVRVDILQLRARSALSAYQAAKDGRESYLRQAEADAAKLEREGAGWAKAFSSQIRASLVGLRGDLDQCHRLLEAAEAAFKSADMKIFAAAVSSQRGSLLGGDDGAAMKRAAAQTLREEGVKDVERMTAALTPNLV